MLKGNKGEWGEIYAFCYLLSSGILKAADKDLNPREDFFFPIIKILRKEYSDTLEYYPGDIIKIYNHDSLILEFNKSDLENNISLLLNKIPQGEKAFEIPESNDFFNSIKITKLKADALHKQDIDIQIHDVNTGISPICGFSIKSYLGACPTLINPGNGTNFVYEITNCSDDIMNAVNAISSRNKLLDRIDFLEVKGCDLISNGEMASTQFKENIEFVDSLMPEILGYALRISYENPPANKGKSLRNVINKLKVLNPMGFSNTNMYEYKLKKLLCACALGMTPEKKWEGAEDANGGYIVVKQDGSVVCYHLYNRTEFEQYLFDYTCFDTPSSTRYGYMQVYKENGKYKIKLNLQVRFI